MNEYILFLLVQLFKIKLPLEFIEQIKEKPLFIANYFNEKTVFNTIYGGYYCSYYKKEAIEVYNQYKTNLISDYILLNIISIDFEFGLPLDIADVIKYVASKKLIVNDYYYRIDLSLEEKKRQKQLPGFNGHYEISVKMLEYDK